MDRSVLSTRALMSSLKGMVTHAMNSPWADAVPELYRQILTNHNRPQYIFNFKLLVEAPNPQILKAKSFVLLAFCKVLKP